MVSIDSNPPADFEGRLLAEAIRIHEGLQERSWADETANTRAQAIAGGFEEKIVCRAREHPLSPAFLASLSRLRWALKIVCALAAVLALSAGLATAHTALTVPEGRPVAFHWALLALLGLASFTLLGWIVLSCISGWALKFPSLGGATIGLSRRLARLYDRGSDQRAVLQAFAEIYTKGPMARWSLAAISHGLWGAFVLGALAMALLILSARQVVFGWETTILSEASYIPLTQALSALPSLVGFATPSLEEITASRWAGQGPLNTDAAGAWASLLIGSVLLYGFLPRVFFFVLSLIAWKRALRNFRLDPMRPEYLRLRQVLMPPHKPDGHEADSSEDVRASSLPAAPLPTAALLGPFALLGLELSGGENDWPPDLKNVSFLDLGLVDSREERRQAIASLSSASPSLLLVAVSLLSTPDRGLANILEELQRSSDAPMILLFAEGARLTRRSAEPARAQRYQDWQRLAGELGLPSNWVIEIDLGDPARKGLPELTALLQGSGP
jgi:hypothetical protein